MFPNVSATANEVTADATEPRPASQPEGAAPSAVPTAAPTAAPTGVVCMLKPDGSKLTFTHPDGFVPVGTKPKVRVIRGPNEITPEWLTPIYQSKGFLQVGGKVKTVQIKPLGDGLGVMGEICLVTTECEGGNDTTPTGFVAKFCPQKLFGFPKPVAETMAKGIFGTEAHWYNDFYEEEIGLPKPQAYFVGAKLTHRRPWRRSPVFCMLIELMPSHSTHHWWLRSPAAPDAADGWVCGVPCAVVGGAQEAAGRICALAARLVRYRLPAIGLISKTSFEALRTCFGDVYDPILAWRDQLKGGTRT